MISLHRIKVWLKYVKAIENLNEKLWQLNKQIMEQNQRLFIENMKFHESLRDGFKPEGRTE